MLGPAAPPPPSRRAEPARAAVAAVVFDLDGTLVDSRRDIAAALNQVLGQRGNPTLELPQVCALIGNGARELVRGAFQLSETDPTLPDLLAEFVEQYALYPAVHTIPYPGVKQTLRQLQDQRVQLALCTNKPRRHTELILGALELRHFFEAIACGDDLPQRKPDPTPLLQIAMQLGVHAEQMVMVGDGAQDVESGQRAGCHTVGVSYGIHPQSMRAANPDHEIANISELIPHITGLISNT